MSSYRARLPRTLSLTLCITAASLAFSPLTRAASSMAIGAGNSASASIDFRIVIPARLQLNLDETADGRAMLSASVYSRKGQIAINSRDDREQSGLATLGQDGIIKRTRFEANQGVYTVASP